MWSTRLEERLCGAHGTENLKTALQKNGAHENMSRSKFLSYR